MTEPNDELLQLLQNLNFSDLTLSCLQESRTIKIEDFLDFVAMPPGAFAREASDDDKAKVSLIREFDRNDGEIGATTRIRAMVKHNDACKERRQREMGLAHEATATNTAIQELQVQLATLLARDSKAVSYANYYDEKCYQQRVFEAWVPQPQGTREYAIDLALLVQGPEKTKVKPSWATLLDSSQLVSGLTNAYEKGYLGPEQPDIQFFLPAVLVPSAHDFIGVGDAKGSDWNATAKGPRGQIMQYCHRILDAQPARMVVYGFITNNDAFLIVRGQRGAQGLICWYFSASLTLKAGLQLYLNLLEDDLQNYAPPPTLNGVQLFLKALIGTGSTCQAFDARYKDKHLVAKRFTSTALAEQNRNQIEIVQAIPRCENDCIFPVVEAWEDAYLLISPKGFNFSAATLRMKHLRSLLLALKSVHEAHIVHWDTRFANIFRILDRRREYVLLNDWGSSGALGVEADVVGSPNELCHPELVDKTRAARLPKHDLFSLVASTAQILIPGLNKEGRANICKAAFVAAEEVDYDGVANALVQLGVPI